MKIAKNLLYLAIFMMSLKNLNVVYSQTHLYFSLGHFDEMEFKNSYLTTADVGVLYETNKFLNIGIGTNIYKFWNSDYSAIGIGLNPLATYNFFTRDNYKLLLEAKGGVIFMFPASSNNVVNYNISIGPGVEFSLKDYKKLKTGIHYNHFSNAKGRGNVINPTWDGFGVDITLLFGRPKKINP